MKYNTVSNPTMGKEWRRYWKYKNWILVCKFFIVTILLRIFQRSGKLPEKETRDGEENAVAKQSKYSWFNLKLAFGFAWSERRNSQGWIVFDSVRRFYVS